HALEAGKYLVVAPSGAAVGCPVVVVGTVAANEDHPVDRAGATEQLAAHRGDLALHGVLLRDRVVVPVEALFQLWHRVHRGDHPGALYQWGAVAAAGFHQDHPGARLGQSIGDDAARTASSYYDVVGLIRHDDLRIRCSPRKSETSST